VRLGCLFLLIPIGEIFVLFELSRRIGIAPILAVLVFTVILGILLLRSAGMRGLSVLQAQTAAGEDPREVWSRGLARLIAGACLLTPGVFTDALGLLVLFPPTRALLRKWLVPHLAERFQAQGGVVISRGVFWTSSQGNPPQVDAPPPRPGEIVQ
jgi:UPF0716 protein FxsA